MKALKTLVSAGIMLAIGAAVAFAQDAQQQDNGSDSSRSDLYVVQIPIERVFLHRKGYVVEYRKTPLVNKRVYIPIEWFIPARDSEGKISKEQPPRKGEVILVGTGRNWPHLAVYYNKDGAVDHIRLYVRRDERHFTWGQVLNPSEIDANFENITEIKLEYK